MATILSPEAIAAERSRRKLSRFVQEFWEIVEPGRPLLWNWHLDVICDTVQMCAQNCGRDVPSNQRNAVIAVPPGSSKSLIVSVFASAWKWLPGNWPHRRILNVSKTARVSVRDSLRTRDILRSDKFQQYAELLSMANALDATFRPWDMSEDQDAKTLYKNSLGGFRQALTVGSHITGSRGDEIIIDDPYDVEEVLKGSPERVRERMEETLDFYDFKLSSRMNDQARGSTVLIMQRVHEMDLVGTFKTREPQNFRWIEIPMEYDPDITCEGDPRTIPGELFFPALFPQSFVDDKKSKDRHGQWASQYQQRPVPAEGGLFKDQWLSNTYKFYPGHWRNNPDLPKFQRVGMSVDCAVKAKRLSDPSVFVVWGEDDKGYHYLLHVWRGREDFPNLCRIAAGLVNAHQPDVVLIEEAGNGVALLGILKEAFTGYSFIGIIPKSSEDKVMRASNTTHMWEAGRVWLPDDNAPFAAMFREEHRSFPFAHNDDQVDATSQWFNWCHENRRRFVHRASIGGVLIEEADTRDGKTKMFTHEEGTTQRDSRFDDRPRPVVDMQQEQRDQFRNHVKGLVGETLDDSLARFPEDEVEIRKLAHTKEQLEEALTRYPLPPRMQTS